MAKITAPLRGLWKITFVLGDMAWQKANSLGISVLWIQPNLNRKLISTKLAGLITKQRESFKYTYTPSSCLKIKRHLIEIWIL